MISRRRTGFLTGTSAAERSEFNKICPAATTCEKLSEARELCEEEKNKKACADFVIVFEQLLPKYDCARPQGTTTIPAIWLCDAFEGHLRFLSKMKTAKAMEVFGSKELRETLDGHLSEEFKKKSLAASKKLKKKKK